MLKCFNPATKTIIGALILFVFFCAPGTATAEIKVHVYGDMDLALGGYWNVPLVHEVGKSEKNDDTFRADFRARLHMRAETSEATRAHLTIRLAKGRMGEKTAANGSDIGYQLDGDKATIRVRQAWMEWGKRNDPLKFRGGIIVLRTPFAAMNSGIMDTSGAGIELNWRPNDTFNGILTWTRPYDDKLNDNDIKMHDEMDLFQLKMPIKLKEHNMLITPWGMYGRIGKDSGYWEYNPAIKNQKINNIQNDGTAWWIGSAFSYKPLKDLHLKLDFAYGRLDTERSKKNFNTKGWQTYVALDYKQSWGTPGLFGWYATGSKGKEAERNRQWGVVPSVSSFDLKFNPTSFGFNADSMPGTPDIINSGYMGWSSGGTWGIGAQITHISFIKDLQHLIRIAYYSGTNDTRLAKTVGNDKALYWGRRQRQDPTILTTGDHVVEVNFNHKYQLYDDASIMLSLGYIRLDRSSDWFKDSPQYRNSKYDKDKNAWQAALGFHYTFNSNK